MHRWREEEAACSSQLAAVEAQLHLLPTLPEMVTLAPAPATNSSSFVQFERTSSRFAPVTVRVVALREDMAEGREVEKKRHSRRLILRKPS